MKTRVLVAAVTAIAVLVFSGCAGTRIRQLSGEDFLKQARQTRQLNSFHWTSYIGCGNERVYLEYGYPALLGSGMRVTVYWTPLSDLPGNLVTQIKAGGQPWTNAMDRVE